MATNEFSLPGAGSRVFFVGIGGIGMSGLAQLFRWQGYDVCGSDRGLDEPGKAELYGKLAAQGIRLYAQDGNGVLKEKPDVLIVSSAVEEGNPDLVAGEGVMRIHRARALYQALRHVEGARMIAVAGSCGKTSVTGWIGSALRALGEQVLVVNGGYYSKECPAVMPGNFYADASPSWTVVEVDESDKSIDEFSSDYGIVLNVGNDHYEASELRRLFGEFLGRCSYGAVAHAELEELLPKSGVATSLFGGTSGIHVEQYRSDAKGIHFEVSGIGHVDSCQAGMHSALNGCGVLSMLKLLDLGRTDAELGCALSAFQGIRQRFEFMGTLANGMAVINDYAHNPEKVMAALKTAREHYGTPMLVAFRPHGFRPLQFMREELVRNIVSLLTKDDCLVILPVFYAGGTASFTPTSEEVAEEMRQAGGNVMAGSREDAENLAFQGGYRCLLVMGARDSSLREWCRQLCH